MQLKIAFGKYIQQNEQTICSESCPAVLAVKERGSSLRKLSGNSFCLSEAGATLWVQCFGSGQQIPLWVQSTLWAEVIAGLDHRQSCTERPCTGQQRNLLAQLSKNDLKSGLSGKWRPRAAILYMAKGYTGGCPRDMTNATVLGESLTEVILLPAAMQTCLISWWHSCPEAKLTVPKWKAAAQSSFAFMRFETMKADRIGQAGWQQFGHLY